MSNLSPMHRRSLQLCATWFGCGLSPWVPGTVGTVGAIPLVWLFMKFGVMGYLYATFTFVVFSVFVAQAYELEIAGAHDTPEVVIDEVAGLLVTMAWLPFHWHWVLLGFLLFRALDMLKPFPISWIDRKILGGVGAVSDDILAGVIANIVLQYLFQHHMWGL
jgi:phosphatidylglycerophosphatase A